MSIDDSINSLGPSTKSLFANYRFADSSFENPIGTNADNSRFRSIVPTSSDDVFTRAYFIPLDSVNSSVSYTENVLLQTKQTLEENLLRKIFIDPNISAELDTAHIKLWEELAKIVFVEQPQEDPLLEDDIFFDINSTGEIDNGEVVDEKEFDDSSIIPINVSQINKSTIPPYICFDEIAFAEKLGSTAARKLLSEYYLAISMSTFSYFYQFRKLIDLFLHELHCIKKSLFYDFGEQYENESQQEIAVHFDTWSKMVLHYSRRIAKTVGAAVEKLPYAEVDQISKKQAAQFQAFFAVRLNAVDSEIHDILDNLKRDLVDNCDVFYSRYLSPALRMTKDISDPLEFDFISTNFTKNFPKLAGEIVVATNSLKGNFVSVHADVIERMDLMTVRVDALFGLIHEKRRYANFISQLANVSVQKPQILAVVDVDLFSQFFRSATVDSSKSEGLRSSHGDLDDLDADSHPQYLLKSGGTVTGDISVSDGVKIDGVDISRHAHTGSDGSAKISILDIDFGPSQQVSESLVLSPASISIEGFIPAILNGGVPVFDAIVSIEASDDAVENYDYEIFYTEID